jgi:Ankyrin repeats (many copies)
LIILQSLDVAHLNVVIAALFRHVEPQAVVVYTCVVLYVRACLFSRLLDAGCDVNRCTRDGTSLHVAVAGGHLEIVILLLRVSSDQLSNAG